MKARQFLAWNLRRVRVSQGLSQEKLAADAGIDRAYLGGIERQTENPSLDLLDRLADALGVALADLLRQQRAGETRPEPLRPGRPAARGGQRPRRS
jgi:transcriptional regulator with XRE-family HTH domain